VDRIGAFLERPGALEPRADAILAPGRRPLMHGALGELVSGVAAGLAAVGLAEGSRIALMVENGPEAACAFLALAQFAAVAPLNPAYRAQELAFYLDDIRADVGAAMQHPPSIGRPGEVVVGRKPGDLHRGAGLRAIPEERIERALDQDLVAARDDRAFEWSGSRDGGRARLGQRPGQERSRTRRGSRG